MDPRASLPASVAAALDRFTLTLRERFGRRLRELVLFGSYARGEAHDESDVDILVVIDDLTDVERREVLDLSYRCDAYAEELVGLAPIVYSTAQAADLRARERRLLRSIDHEGLRL